MALKPFRPTTPGVRGRVAANFEDLTRGARSLRSLTSGLRATGGRNHFGRITTRFRGGGHKRRYRLVDFARAKTGIPARIAAIEYDPNRSARIARVNYVDGERRYIICPAGVRVGDTVVSSRAADVAPGNALPLRAIPLGTMVHNVELKIGAGGQVARAAGTCAQLMARDGDWGQLRLPSGEIRLVHVGCRATIGQVGNVEHGSAQTGKAGRSRWRGRRPHNRGVTQNPVDHPMGGGEGRSSGGRHPCSPWGQLSKGLKTRMNKRTDRLIVRRRGARG